MPLLFTGLIALAVLQQESYDPARHITWIEKQVVATSKLTRSIRDKKTTPADAARSLGKTLADSRKFQTKLSKFTTTAEKDDAKAALRAIQASGLLEAWLTSAIFGLDGDQASKDLAAAMEKRLIQLLHSIKDPTKGGEKP